MFTISLWDGHELSISIYHRLVVILTAKITLTLAYRHTHTKCTYGNKGLQSGSFLLQKFLHKLLPIYNERVNKLSILYL